MIMAKLSNACLFCSFVMSTTITVSSAILAAGTYEERRDCRSDAMKFCGDFAPDVKRITECMEKNMKKLSAPCRKHFR